MKPRVWIIRWQLSYMKVFKSPLLSSLLIFGIPWILLGITGSILYGINVFSMGVCFGLLWLSIAPYLINVGFKRINHFFENTEWLFPDTEILNSLWNKALERIYSIKYLWINNHLFIPIYLENRLLNTVIYS